MDGRLVDTEPALPLERHEEVRLGGIDVWGDWFDERIDELRIYERALSGAEVQTDMETPLQTPKSGPVAAWSFDEGEGTTVADVTGHAHTATIHNVTLDDEHAAKLARLADRTHVQEGTLARSLLSTALDDADPDAARITEILDAIPGAWHRRLAVKGRRWTSWPEWPRSSSPRRRGGTSTRRSRRSACQTTPGLGSPARSDPWRHFRLPDLS